MPDVEIMLFMVDDELVEICGNFADVIVILKLLHSLFVLFVPGVLLITGVIFVIV